MIAVVEEKEVVGFPRFVADSKENGLRRFTRGSTFPIKNIEFEYKIEDDGRINFLNKRNKASDYGFVKVNEYKCLEIIQTKPIDSITDEEKEFVLANLGDPNDDESMAWLVENILENGLKNPVGLQYKAIKENGELVHECAIPIEGSRRITSYLVINLMGKEFDQIPFTTVGKISLEDQLLYQVIGNAGKKASPLMRAFVWDELIKSKGGYSLPEDELNDWYKYIAKKAGCTVQRIKDELLLLTSSPTVQRLIQEERVSASAVITNYKENELHKDEEEYPDIPTVRAIVDRAIVETVKEVEEQKEKGLKPGRASTNKIQDKVREQKQSTNIPTVVPGVVAKEQFSEEEIGDYKRSIKQLLQQYKIPLSELTPFLKNLLEGLKDPEDFVVDFILDIIDESAIDGKTLKNRAEKWERQFTQKK